jgi:galactokinase
VVNGLPSADALLAAGLSASRRDVVLRTLPQLDEALRRTGAATASRTLLVPGRVEVFGKHTDYAGGESLLCAVERGFVARVAPRSDAVVRVIDIGRSATLEVPLTADQGPRPSGWANYVVTAVRRLASNFPEAVTGCDIALRSDLPAASGLSSSSALIVLIAKAVIAVNALDRTREWSTAIGSLEEEAAYLGTIENGADFKGLAGVTGVGTFGGSEDHAAILGARPHALLHVAFAPLRRRGVLMLPADHVFAIAVSGVVADKTGTARERYNAVSGRARQLVVRWNAGTGAHCHTLAEVLGSAPDAAAQLRALLQDQPDTRFPTDDLMDRLAHFEAEWRTHLPEAARALAARDVAAFGAAADASQASAERWLRNQVPETILLQRLAREQGASAASAFGAGFGGAVWALVPRAIATPFASRWLASYRATALGRRQRRATAFLSEAAPALLQFGPSTPS